VARDQAFCFVFEETLEAFEALGCAIVPFSPLADVALPPDLGGLYLPGGYPEVHAAALAANTPLLQAVHAAVTAGLPTIAECGGFMYLHDEIDGHPMAGAIPGRAYPTGRLCRFGYVTLTARRDNLLCRQGESLPAHEFHYYDSTNAGDGFEAVKASGTARYTCAHTSATLYAGFPHLALAARPAAAARFVAAATEFAASHRDGPLTTLTRSTSDEHVIWGPSPCDVEGVER
jgi:cobyrinic acid a,c-diamide synthase